MEKVNHSTYHRSDVQGLRAVAVIFVFLYHAGAPVASGFIGVDVFFTISGYVITAMLIRDVSSSKTNNLKRFYVKRFLRLYPALATMITVVSVSLMFTVVSMESRHNSFISGIGALGGIANFVLSELTGGYFDAPAESNPFLHTWSLSIEEQFYFIFPVMLLWTFRRNKVSSNRRHLETIIFIGIITLASFFYMQILEPESLLPAFYNPLARIWEFTLGALIAVALAKPYWNFKDSKFLDAIGVIGFTVLVLSSLFLVDEREFPSLITLVPVVATALIIALGQNSSSLINRYLSSRIMVLIGNYSYSIYLWHWPFIVLSKELWPGDKTATGVAALMSIFPALLSYRFIEQRFRASGNEKPKLGKGVLITFLLCPFLALALLFVVSERVMGSQEMLSSSAKLKGDIGHQEIHEFVAKNYFPCTPAEFREKALYWEGFLRCQQSLNSEKIDIALFGDSHVEHLFLGLAEAIPEKNIAYYQRSALPIREEGMGDILDYLVSDKNISVVVIAASWETRTFPFDAMKRTISTLTSSGKEVFITDDVPHFDFNPAQCKYGAISLSKESRCTISAADNQNRYMSFEGQLRQVVNETGIHLIETNKSICSDKFCSMATGDSILYRDMTHLNMPGSRFLAKVMIDQSKEFREAVGLN
jgi:peptidoglycan/LPS O-acetylase OafA/YrhL